MISIVVVTFNRLEYTRQCLDSIIRNTDVEAELIVIDNGSTDGTVDYLKAFSIHNYAGVRQCVRRFLGENRGCAEGYNTGFDLAVGDPIWRIDNDVIVPPGYASAQYMAMKHDPKLGMLTTDLETDPRANPSNVRLAEKHGVTYFGGPVWHDHGLGSWCMAHRRAMLEEVGYYRTDYGLIVMNDTDLQKRSEKAGWRSGTLSGLVVGHLWTMRSIPGEIEYNYWKLSQQREHVETWEKIWGKERR